MAPKKKKPLKYGSWQFLERNAGSTLRAEQQANATPAQPEVVSRIDSEAIGQVNRVNADRAVQNASDRQLMRDTILGANAAMGQRINSSDTFLATGEAQKYGAGNVEAVNQAEAAAGVKPDVSQTQVDPGSQFLSDWTGIGQPQATEVPIPLTPTDYLNVGNSRFAGKVDVESALVTLTANKYRDQLPVSMRNMRGKKEFIVAEYPTLMQAALAAGASDAEVEDAINFTLATDAAMKIAAAYNDERRKQLLGTMEPFQQALVLDILQAMGEEVTWRQAEDKRQSKLAEEYNRNAESGSLPLDIGRKIWDWGIAPMFNALIAQNEFSLHAVRAGLMLPEYGTDAWRMTERGTFDPEGIAMWREVYGKEAGGNEAVNIILELKRAETSGDDDPIGTVLDKYGDDPMTGRILDSLFNGVDSQQWMQDLATAIDSSDMGNLGNIGAWSFLASPFPGMPGGFDISDPETANQLAQSAVFTFGSKATDITTTFAYDPLLTVSALGKAYKVLRYGVGQLGKDAYGSARIATAMQRSGSRNFWNKIGGDFEKVRELEAAGKQADAAQLMNSIAMQNQRWFGRDGAGAYMLKNAGIKNADDAIKFFEDGDNLRLLMQGQTAKRGWENTVPHMTKAMAQAKAVTLKARGLNPSNMGAKKYVDAVLNTAVDLTGISDNAFAALAKAMNDHPERMGQIMSDFVIIDETGQGARTLSGMVIDLVTLGRDTNKVKYLDRYGWARQGVRTADPGAVFDRLGRLMARRRPDRPINIEDASDADFVKQWAQAIGMRRYFANILKEQWVVATPQMRMQMVEGLNRTQIYASGIQLSNPVYADDLLKRSTAATRGSTAYTADMRDTIAMRAAAERELRQTNPELFVDDYAVKSAELKAQRDSLAMDYNQSRLEVDYDLSRAQTERATYQESANVNLGFTQSLDEFQQADEELSRLQAELQNAMDSGADATAASNAVDARLATLEREWMDAAMQDPRIRELLGAPATPNGAALEFGTKQADDYLASQGLPNGKTPAEYVTQFGDEFDQIPVQQLETEGFVSRTSAGSAAELDTPGFVAASKNFDKHGLVTRNDLARMADEYDSEAVWSWFNTGRTDTHLIDGQAFFDRYGPAPKFLPDPGKGPAAVRAAARIPGEYTRYATDLPGKQKGVGIRVPWKGTADERAAYIDSKYQELQQAALDDATQAADNITVDDVISALDQKLSTLDETVAANAPDAMEAVSRIDELDMKIGQLTGDLAIIDSVRSSELAQIEAKLNEMKPLTKAERKARKQQLDQAVTDRVRVMWDDAEITNPSVVNGMAHAIRDTQLAGRASVLPLPTLEKWSAKSGYWGLLLGNNKGISTATDMWVLGTLMGPRFIGRSGIEDAGLYAYTGGSFRDWLVGMKSGNAFRTATVRVEKDASKTRPARSRKVGMINAATTRAIDRLHPALGSFLERNLTPEQKLKANELLSAPAAERSTEGIVQLFSYAFLVQGLGRLKNKRWQNLFRSPKSAEQAAGNQRYLEEAVRYNHLGDGYALAAESSIHLSDSVMPNQTLDAVAEKVGHGSRQYVRTVDVYGTTSQPSWNMADRNDFHRELVEVLHGDGIKGYKAFQFSQRWYAARVHFAKTGDRSKMDAVLADYVPFVEQDESVAKGMYVLASDANGGVRGLAERKLDDVLRMMTTRNGKYNIRLRQALAYEQVDEVTGETYTLYGAFRNVDGERQWILHPDTFDKDNIPIPQSVRTTNGVEVVTSGEIPWTSRLWDIMGDALARLTREPIFTANYLDSRRMIAGWESDLAERIGAEAASKQASEVAYQRAYRMTMDYVDDPNIRSQLAWQVRNVARFYRATEDFNRRMVRVIENQPETFWKLALTWNVLDDSGFIWEDEYGDKYFMFPILTPVFQTLNRAIQSFTGSNLVVPNLPLAFGGKVTMLTPSADPNAWIPTLAGPWTGVPLRAVTRMFPLLNDLEDDLFGPYSTSQSPVSAAITSMFGPNVNNLIEASFAGVGGDKKNQSDTYFATVAKQAMVAVAAAGLYDPEKQYTQSELDEIFHVADVTALNIVIAKLFLYPTLPVSPQVMADDVSDFARSLGFDSMNAIFLDYVAKYDGDPGRALIEFTKTDPGKAIFTISKYKYADGVGRYAQLVETQDFLDENIDVMREFPTGLAYFAPNAGTPGGLPTFKFMMDNGIRVKRSVGEYWTDLTTTVGYQLAKQLRDNTQSLIDAGVTPERERDLRTKEQNGIDEINRAYPGTRSRLSGESSLSGNRAQDDYMKDVEEVRGALSALRAKGVDPKNGELYDGLLQLYDNFAVREQRIIRGQVNDAKAKRDLSTRWRSALEQWAPLSEDEMWQNFLFITSKALGVEP